MKPTRAELNDAVSEQASPDRLAELAAKNKVLARAVASNAAAPGELLDRLAEHEDKAVRRRVVRNPATPAKTVARAGREFPDDLLDNPAFDLYLIEEPDLLTDCGEATLRALLKRESCPASFFAYAARRGDIDTQLALLINPSATAEAVEICREKHWSDHDRSPAWKQRKGIIEACDLHRSSARDVDWRARFAAGLQQARVGETPKAEQFALAEVSLIIDGANTEMFELPERTDSASRLLFSSLHIDLATNPTTPTDVLERLAGSDSIDARCAVALNPSTPPHVLETLAASEVSDIRRTVACNPNTPDQTLAALASTENPEVRSTVARNRSAPLDLLHSLASDSDRSVRSGVAENPSTPRRLLETLAFDEDESPQGKAQLRLAGDQSTPLHILEVISRGADRRILIALLSNSTADAKMLKLPLEYLASSKGYWTKRAVAAHRSSPPELLAALAAEDSDSFGQALAANPSCPPDVLEDLVSKDEYCNLRHLVASNRACSIKLLETLAGDEDIRVRRAVSNNPVTPVKTRQALIEDLGPDLERIALAHFNSPDVLETLVRDEGPVIRRKVAKRRDLTRRIQELLSRDPSAGVRYTLAANRTALPEVLAMLAEDKNPCVRWMVAENKVTPPELRESLPRGPEGFRDWFRGNVNRRLSNDDFAPPSVLEILSSDNDDHVRHMAAFHKSLPWQSLHQLSRDAGEDIRTTAQDRLARSPFVPLEVLTALAGADDASVRRGVAENPSTPVRLLETLARDDDADARSGVAANPSAPARLLEMMVDDGDAEVRQEVASNPTTPARLFDALTTDEDVWVRRNVAGNSATPVRLLVTLAGDEDAHVRTNVSKNSSSPVPLLETLAGDEKASVREGVASNNATPLRLLESLAGDEDAHVRIAVAFNGTAPLSLLKTLALDHNRWVRSRAKEAVRRTVTEENGVAQDAIESSAWKNSGAARKEYAKNSNSAVELLTVLANDDDQAVRVEVARNPSSPPSLLSVLVLDSDRMVRVNAACHPAFDGKLSVAEAIPPDVRPTFRLGFTKAGLASARQIKAARAAADPVAAARELRTAWIRDLTRTTRPGVSRLAALAQPDCSPDALARAQRSSWWLERCVIATNPATPLSALRGLARDGNAVVQSAAVEALTARGESLNA